MSRRKSAREPGSLSSLGSLRVWDPGSLGSLESPSQVLGKQNIGHTGGPEKPHSKGSNTDCVSPDRVEALTRDRCQQAPTSKLPPAIVFSITLHVSGPPPEDAVHSGSDESRLSSKHPHRPTQRNVSHLTPDPGKTNHHAI